MPVKYTCDICGKEVTTDSLYKILFHRPKEATFVKYMVNKDMYLCEEHILLMKDTLDKIIEICFHHK